MSRLLIIGAGGFGFEVALICDNLLRTESADFTSYALLDDSLRYAEERGCEDLVVGMIKDHQIDPEARYCCAIGNPETRKHLVENFEARGARFCSVIDPTAVVSARAKLGRGLVICAHTFVSCFAEIGNFVHINVASTIGHDARVGAYSTLSAHVDLTGNVGIEEGVFFGTHAAVLPDQRIGAWSKVGAGCTVMRKIGPRAIVYTDPPHFLSRGG